MSDSSQDEYWTRDEVEKRLAHVRDALLGFLRERTRLDWFKHKVRWRLSRQYIWPAAPESRRAMLDEAVEDDASVDAFSKHLAERQHTISDAIESYNHALRRLREKELGLPLAQFSPTELEALRRRRITFAGVRDELRWRAREIKASSDPELFPELLSLRLAILVAEVRDEIFSEVASIVADEKADASDGMTQKDRDLLAQQIDLRLRCLDRHNVTRLLAENYAEGRRFMNLDALWSQCKVIAGELRDQDPPAHLSAAKLELYREILKRSLGFLEAIFPSSAGTHQREMALLRQVPDTP